MSNYIGRDVKSLIVKAWDLAKANPIAASAIGSFLVGFILGRML